MRERGLQPSAGASGRMPKGRTNVAGEDSGGSQYDVHQKFRKPQKALPACFPKKKPSRIASSQVTSRNFPQMIPCSGRGGSYPDPKSLTSSSSLVSHPRDDEKPLSNHVFC